MDSIKYEELKEDIDKCLNCTKPRCTNCLETLNKAESLREFKEHITLKVENLTDLELKIVDLYMQGYYDSEMSDKTGDDYWSIRRIRQNLGLPSMPHRSIDYRKEWVNRWMSLEF